MSTNETQPHDDNPASRTTVGLQGQGLNTYRRWVNAVVSSPRLPMTDRLVAVTLAGYADSRMESADPGRKRIAEDLGVSVSTVKRALKVLISSGWIEKTHEGRISLDREQCDAYRLLLPTAAALSVSEEGK